MKLILLRGSARYTPRGGRTLACRGLLLRADQRQVQLPSVTLSPGSFPLLMRGL